MTANDWRNKIYFRLLNLRNMHGLVLSEKFTQIYSQVSEAQRASLDKALEDGDFESLSRLLKEYAVVDLELMTVRDLRRLAQSYGIKHYNHLTRPSLLSAIKARENVKHEINRVVGKNETTTPESRSQEEIPTELVREVPVPQ